ncbi:M15 family metallopeptidase [Promicromonospora kroppenstedtii]|uniref:M15 family metallopeptidase n=1 Tax=Promicromonospora kroppenstedtii TaxID=440482 RepID=A0ABW7XHR2_9MICO
MTLTNTVPPAQPTDGRPDGSARERREAKARRRRALRRTLAATIVVVVLLGLAGLSWYLVSDVEDLGTQNVAARHLLASSESRVADPATREALAEQIAAADAVLAEPFLTRLTMGTAEVGDALGAASDAVRASMVDLARHEVTAARKSLAAATGRGEKIYAATEGKGADDTVRSSLRAALDTSTAADAAASSAFTGTDLERLGEAEYDLSTKRSVVTAATEAMATAQDAVTCPAPDQVWDPDSGKLQKDQLARIPWAPDFVVRADVLDGLIALDEAYQAEFGTHLTINSAYRSYASQEELYDPSSPIAAPPGCSNHGLGLAVDIGGGVETFDTPQYNWLKTHAEAHGWIHPAFAEPNGRVPEPWHWQSVLARESS